MKQLQQKIQKKGFGANRSGPYDYKDIACEMKAFNEEELEKNDR